MNILITGSTGFVGRYLTSYLKQQNITYVALNRANIGDFTHVSDWTPYLKDIDVVIHLAGRAHRMHEDQNDVKALYYKENVDVTISLAKDAAKVGVKKFIYLSSIKAMGEGKIGPYRETDTPDPQDIYGKSKLEAEQQLKQLSLESAMKVTVIRPPLIYGPGVKANFKSLMNIVRRETPLPFKGFRAKRSYLFVGNLVDVILCVAKISLDNNFNLLLVSDGQDMSLPELISTMTKILGVRERLFYFPVPFLKSFLYIIGKKNIYQRLNSELTVDISKVMREYNWYPPYTVEEGIRITDEKSI